MLAVTKVSAAKPYSAKQGDCLSDYVWDETAITPGDLKQIEAIFAIDTIADCTMERMLGKSYPQEGCVVSRADLRYLILPHYDGKGSLKIGEMVCNKAVAKEFLDVFKQLFRKKYPIERMELIDNYDADDIRSMEANNTSCFNFRRVAGSTKLSRHSYGMAIDINPLYNPYVKGSYVSPVSGKPYVNRANSFPYKLTRTDAAYKLLHDKYGFTWGGAWRSCKDYQHFEK